MIDDNRGNGLTRRQTLGVLGAAGAISFLDLRRGARAWAAPCVATPAETEGPYFVDERLQRADITVDPTDGSVSAGVPLRLAIRVLRTDADCASAEGVQVDVWHADADGSYSDEASVGTAGRRFLRGYQLTDELGAVAFTTIYPGWYPGRTIHVHFKLRTFSGSTTTFEFTSQLYFDDALSDSVMAEAPYAARGARDTTNATDAIFSGTTALVVALTSDGNGGYVGSFDVGVGGLPATTSSGGATCEFLTTCSTALAAALPNPDAAANAKSRRVARRLARLDTRLNRALDRAGSAETAREQGRFYRRASAALRKLLAVARAADRKGTLGVALDAIDRAGGGMRTLL